MTKRDFKLTRRSFVCLSSLAKFGRFEILGQLGGSLQQGLFFVSFLDFRSFTSLFGLN
jgi:hypothetical protein